MLLQGVMLNARFEIVRQIGQGGMGAVYECLDHKFGGSTVAIKQCLLTSEAMKRAFNREADLMARLRHQNLPKVIDKFVEGDNHFLAMEYIDGEDLEGLLARRGQALEVNEVLGWMAQLLDALDYMHRQEPPVIHRDIKPGNIKLTPQKHIMLIDFGLAKGSGTKSINGYSLNFAPLEQVEESGSDARSDLYSLGATMYRLLSGQMPISAFERAKAQLRKQPDPLVPLHQYNPNVSISVSHVITEAMALMQEDRSQSASEMKQKLQEALENKHLIIESKYSTTHVSEPIYSKTEIQVEQTSQHIGYQRTKVSDGNESSPMLNTIANKELQEKDEQARADIKVKPSSFTSLKSPEQAPVISQSRSKSKLPIYLVCSLVIIGLASGGIWYQHHQQQLKVKTEMAEQIGEQIHVLLQNIEEIQSHFEMISSEAFAQTAINRLELLRQKLGNFDDCLPTCFVEAKAVYTDIETNLVALKIESVPNIQRFSLRCSGLLAQRPIKIGTNHF